MWSPRTAAKLAFGPESSRSMTPGVPTRWRGGVGGYDAGQALTFMFPCSLLPLPPSQLKQLSAVAIRICRDRDPDLAVSDAPGTYDRPLPGGGGAPGHRRARGVGIPPRPRARRPGLGDARDAPTRPAHPHPGLHPAAAGRTRAAAWGDRRRTPHLPTLSHKLFQEQGTTVAGWIRQRRSAPAGGTWPTSVGVAPGGGNRRTLGLFQRVLL